MLFTLKPDRTSYDVFFDVNNIFHVYNVSQIFFYFRFLLLLCKEQCVECHVTTQCLIVEVKTVYFQFPSGLRPTFCFVHFCSVVSVVSPYRADTLFQRTVVTPGLFFSNSEILKPYQFQIFKKSLVHPKPY